MGFTSVGSFVSSKQFRAARDCNVALEFGSFHRADRAISTNTQPMAERIPQLKPVIRLLLGILRLQAHPTLALDLIDEMQFRAARERNVE